MITLFGRRFQRNDICSIVAAMVLYGLLGPLFVASATPPDPAGERKIILHIGFLNPDCYRDTVLGMSPEPGQYLPTKILWGRYGGSGEPCGHGNGNNQIAMTEFRYPQWAGLSGSTSFMRLNGDTLMDIVLELWGHAGEPRRDTTVSFVVFGQKRLAKADILKLDSLGHGNANKYSKRLLLLGEDFTDKKVRDLSGRPSYILQRNSDNAEDTATQAIDVLASVEEPLIRVYPNPTVYSTNMEVTRIPEGEYAVLVIAEDGQVQMQQRVTVGSDGLFRTLNVSDLPTGYYIIQIHSRGKIVGSYPIVLLH